MFSSVIDVSNLIETGLDEQDTKRFQDDMVKLNRENERLYTQCTEQHIQVSALHSANQVLKQECDNFKDEIRALTGDVLHLERENQHFQQETNQLKTVCNEQAAQISSFELEKLVFIKRRNDDEDEIRNVNAEVQKLNQENIDLQQESKHVNEENQRLKEKNQQLEIQCHHQETKIGSLQSEKEALKQNCDDQEEGRRAERAAAEILDEEIITIKQENQRLKENNEHLHIKCNQQQIQIDRLESEKLVFMQEHANTEEELHNHKDTNLVLINEEIGFRKEKEVVDQEDPQLETENEYLEIQCEQKQIQITSVKPENETLKQCCDAYEEVLCDKEAPVQRRNHNHDIFEQKDEHVRQRKHGLNESTEYVETHCEQKQIQATGLESENQTLKQPSDQCEKEALNANAKVQSLNHENTDPPQESENVNAENQFLQQEIDGMENKSVQMKKDESK